MRRQVAIGWVLLACLALFVIASSEMMHVHDGFTRGELGCPSCAAAVLIVLVPAAVALARAVDDRPRRHHSLALVWPITRRPYRLAARGPPSF